jgi:transposase
VRQSRAGTGVRWEGCRPWQSPIPRSSATTSWQWPVRGQAPLAQIAKDFGISEGTSSNWIKRADIEDGNRPGLTEEERRVLREARKRVRLLEQENEVLRRAAAYLSQANLPGK